jgi:hypothetical protein
MMKLMSAVGLAPPVSRSHEPHVALFYAVGDVVDGAGDGVLGAREQIASHTVIRGAAPAGRRRHGEGGGAAHRLGRRQRAGLGAHLARAGGAQGQEASESCR